jgi:hypothetical protein
LPANIGQKRPVGQPISGSAGGAWAYDPECLH